MSARVSSMGLTARMLRRRPGPGLVVTVLSIVLSAAIALVPVVLSVLDDRIAQDAVESLSPGLRDLVATAAGTIDAGPAPDGSPAGMSPEAAGVWGAFDAHLESARDELDPPLKPLVGPAAYVARTDPEGISGGNGHGSLGFLVDPRYQEHASLVEGAWPASFAFDYTPGDLTTRPTIVPPPVVEVVLSADAATALEWKVGETRETDVWAQLGAPGVPVKLVGIFAPALGSDDYWMHLDTVLTPHIEYHDLVSYPAATGFVAPESLYELPSATIRLLAWYPFQPEGVVAADVPEITAQLRTFTANPVTVGTSDGVITRLTFDTEAIPTLEHALDTQGAMAAVFAITAAGPAGAAIAVLAVACRVIARGRRPALALLSARGASSARLRALQAWHGVWFGSVAALVAGAAVVAVVMALGRAVSPLSVVGAVAVAALPPAILAAISPPGPRLQEEVPGEPNRAQRRRRLAVELVVVVAAVLAAAALVSAMISGDRLGSGGSPASGLAILAPLLAALVGCVVALRLYPLPLRALLTRLRRAPALTGFLGAARALRESAVGVAPVLALLIGVSSATMSGVLLGSMQHEIDVSARAAAGADLQIARADLTPDAVEKLSALDGVAAVAPIGSVTRIPIEAGSSGHVLATLLVADPDALAAVQDPGVPILPPDADLDATGAAVPVVLARLTSSQLSGATEFTVNAEPARATGVSGFAGLPGVTEVWALVAESRLADVTRETPQERNAFVKLTPGADAATVAAAVQDVVGDEATVLSAPVIRDELSQRTGTAAIRFALLAATAAAALFGALAVVLSLVLSAPARDRLFGLLRALGAPARVGRGLVWWELWPPLAASVVVGLVVGLAVPALLLATVDFGVFIDTEPAYHLDPLLLGGAVLGFLALTAVFTVVALAFSRRVRATAVLRQSQEG